MKYKFIFMVVFLICFINITCLSFAAEKIDEHWANDTIVKFKEKGYIDTDEEEFILDDVITVKDASFILTRFLNYGSEKDIDGVEFIRNKGCFLSHLELDNVSREEMATVICKLFDFDNNLSNETMFEDDDDISIWAKSSVYTLEQKKIVIGYPDNTFKPSNKITKAEFITLLNRCDSTGGLLPIIDDDSGDSFEVGIVEFENESIKIKKIDDDLVLKKGDIVELAFTLPDDVSDEIILNNIDKQKKVVFDSELNMLEAKRVGKSSIKFYIPNTEYEFKINIIVKK